jgi:transcriptional regulator with XRE-family HTH domain
MQLRTIFIQNLKKYRKQRGFSQMTFAEQCHTSTSYIGQIEIGNRFPSLSLIEKMARALQIKPYLLFVDELDADAPKKPLSAKKGVIPDSVKDKLIKRLNLAIRKVVKQINK